MKREDRGATDNRDETELTSSDFEDIRKESIAQLTQRKKLDA